LKEDSKHYIDQLKLKDGSLMQIKTELEHQLEITKKENEELTKQLATHTSKQQEVKVGCKVIANRR
jgi:hypothetical protein